MKPEKSCLPVWQISKCGGVGSERENFLPRRLPNFLFPHYRSKRKFVAIPVQRVAVGFSFVSLAKREKGRAQRAGSPALFALCTEKPGQGQSAAVTEQVSTTVPKSAILRFCPSRETCWGVPSPNPALRLAPLIPAALMRQERRSRPCERNTTRPTAAAL